MTKYRLVTFEAAAGPRAGLVVDDALGPDPRTLGLKAWRFIRSSRTVVGPGATVALPKASKKADWEVA